MLVTGLGLLTQLKNLSMHLSYKQGEEIFSGLMTLTQLKEIALNIDVNMKVSNESFSKITNLTNLERLELKHFSGSFAFLGNLPKLSNISIEHVSSTQEDYMSAVSIIGQLSRLTALQINNNSNSLKDFSLFSGLTNLENISICSKVHGADFSAFTKLTKLDLRPQLYEFRMSNLPPNLEELTLASFELHENDIQAICSLSKLKVLEVMYNYSDPIFWCQWTSRLSNLNTLSISPTLSAGNIKRIDINMTFNNELLELIPALQQLTNLGKLTLEELPVEIDKLSVLTQISEFNYSIQFDKDLKKKLPFRCVFLGPLGEQL